MPVSVRLAAYRPDSASGPQPKTPLLGWSSFRPHPSVRIPALDDARYRAYTTSGRAALWAALQQMDLPRGSGVLVPTYHCPTMVAPIVLAGHLPLYYAIGEDGLPLLETIAQPSATGARAMFVAHYFGLPASLRAVRDWCDARGVLLVEDCAHSFFGMAGDRPVGQWGDYATASVSKFFPVMEGGLLASHRRPLRSLHLCGAGLRYQIKSLVDPIELAVRYGRLGGLQRLLAFALSMRPQRRPPELGRQPNSQPAPEPAQEAMRGSDMQRVTHAPGWAALALHRLLPRARIVQARRDNYQRLAAGLDSLTAGRLLRPELPVNAVPYVCPLWVEGASRADAVYARMRAERLAVHRWDQLWPGVPRHTHDSGARWSREVIQLICHQDLSPDEIDRTIAMVRRSLSGT
jgi:dTDP-4-amino-4,6-dideoxygalactose transaminase